MAAKYKGKDWPDPRRPKPFTPATFVNQELTREQREHLKAIDFGFEQLENVIQDFLDTGFQVKLSVDNRNNCYAAWLLPVGDEHDNKGYILSGRGSTPIKAVKQLWYLHNVVFERNWGVGHGTSNEPIDD